MRNVAKNIYNVPKKEWARMGDVGQAVFNRTWQAIKMDGDYASEPISDLALTVKQKRVFRFNVSYMAAFEANNLSTIWKVS